MTIYMYIYTYVCMYIYIIYVYVYTHAHTHTHTHRSKLGKEVLELRFVRSFREKPMWLRILNFNKEEVML